MKTQLFQIKFKMAGLFCSNYIYKMVKRMSESQWLTSVIYNLVTFHQQQETMLALSFST